MVKGFACLHPFLFATDVLRWWTHQRWYVTWNWALLVSCSTLKYMGGSCAVRSRNNTLLVHLSRWQRADWWGVGPWSQLHRLQLWGELSAAYIIGIATGKGMHVDGWGRCGWDIWVMLCGDKDRWRYWNYTFPDGWYQYGASSHAGSHVGVVNWSHGHVI